MLTWGSCGRIVSRRSGYMHRDLPGRMGCRPRREREKKMASKKTCIFSSVGSGEFAANSPGRPGAL